MGILSAFVVLLMVILGFLRIGGPGTQRMQRADDKRIQDLYQLSAQIQNRWRSGNKLAHDLGELSGVAISDPITRTAYDYHAGEGSKYELCATFSAASRRDNAVMNRDEWSHAAGRHCFSLDAAQPSPSPGYFPGY
jgi:hypothetical protein